MKSKFNNSEKAILDQLNKPGVKAVSIGGYGKRHRNAAMSLVRRGWLKNDDGMVRFDRDDSNTERDATEVCSVGLTVSDWSECNCSNCK